MDTAITPSQTVSTTPSTSTSFASSTATDVTVAISPPPIRTPKTKEAYYHLCDTMPQNWTRSYGTYMAKIKKAGAILYTEKRLLSKAHTDTFAANTTKKGRFLEQNKAGISGGTTYGAAFGRVLSLKALEEAAAKHDAEVKEKERLAAEKQAAKDASARKKEAEKLAVAERKRQRDESKRLKDEEKAANTARVAAKKVEQARVKAAKALQLKERKDARELQRKETREAKEQAKRLKQSASQRHRTVKDEIKNEGDELMILGGTQRVFDSNMVLQDG